MDEPIPLSRDSGATRNRGPVPAIVVVAYDRPRSLARLLGSLEHTRAPEGVDIPLVISIDESVQATMSVADRFDWPFGTKRVIGRPSRLGLRAHVLACGDLTAEYGSVMMLEDDLYVSPDAYRFAHAAATFYETVEQVAGVSLYAYRLDEFHRLSFHPLDDGFDTFFMQLPSSWGQVWTQAQWSRFRAWQHSSRAFDPIRLPQNASKWPHDKSWKRSFLEYLIDTGRYFVYPRVSLTTNCGDAGAHFRRATINLTAPLASGAILWRFAAWAEEAIRYDAWFEPTPATVATRWPHYADGDVTIDFRGSKAAHQVRTSRLLSSRPCANPSARFPMLLQPEALNLELPDHGSFFSLGLSPTFGEMSKWRQRRMFEALNGEIDRRLAGGILVDRVLRRLRRDLSDWRVG